MGISFTGEKRTLLVAALLLLGGATAAFAEQQPYALPQLIDYAVRHNWELSAFREELGTREASRTKSGLYPNPVFEFESSTGSMTGSREESSLSLGLFQEFLVAGRKEKRLLVAEHELTAFSFLITDRQRLLVEEISTSFYDALLAGKRLELVERATALNRKLLDITQERLAAGDIPELEANLIRVELARSESRKIDMRRDIISTRSRLSSLIGLPSEETVAISGSLDAPPAPKALPELIRTALQLRPDLKAVESVRAKSAAEASLAEAERIPNVTAGLAVKRETTATEAGRSGENYLIGLKLTMPIPLFDRNQAGIQEAQSRKSSAELRYQAVKKTIAREVETAYARLNSAESIVIIYGREIIPQLEENLKLVQEAYSLGEIGILAVIEEQKKFFEVNDSYLSALHNRLIAYAKLQSAVATELGGGVQ